MERVVLKSTFAAVEGPQFRQSVKPVSQEVTKVLADWETTAADLVVGAPKEVLDIIDHCLQKMSEFGNSHRMIM